LVNGSLCFLDAAEFKNSDEAFSKRFEARQQLEAYISRVEEMVSDPSTAVKLKRGQKEKIEASLSEAMGQLEIEDTTAEELKKKVRRKKDGGTGILANGDVGTCAQANRYQGILDSMSDQHDMGGKLVRVIGVWIFRGDDKRQQVVMWGEHVVT